MDFNLKNIFSVAALLSTLWAVVATSNGGTRTLDNGTYKVSSDCVTPVRQGDVIVANFQVIGGTATSYTDFGFPSPIVNGTSEVVGTVGAIQRICLPTYSDEDEHAYIYSCYDNGVANCTIAIQ